MYVSASLTSRKRLEKQACNTHTHTHLFQEHRQVRPSAFLESTGPRTKLELKDPLNLTLRNSQGLAEEIPVPRRRPFSQKLGSCISPYRTLPSSTSQSILEKFCLGLPPEPTVYRMCPWESQSTVLLPTHGSQQLNTLFAFQN